MARASGDNNGFDVNPVRFFSEFRIPGFDMEATLEAQRKNLEALVEANQAAIGGVRAAAAHQADMMRQALGEAAALLRDWTQPTPPEQRFVQQTEAVKQAFDQSVANFQALNELGRKAGADVFGIFARRISEGLDEVQRYTKRQAAAE
jgi:phasin family protein